MTSYGVAKAAQDKLTKDLAFEFATKGVRVNSVLPGTPTSLFLLAALTHPSIHL
jgi:NAD(P)-dependent dehydrogenase (short-subunit alcohol dehydrogenase family)